MLVLIIVLTLLEELKCMFLVDGMVKFIIMMYVFLILKLWLGKDQNAKVQHLHLDKVMLQF